MSVDSSALPGPIPGYVYLGKPLPGDRYRLILTANGYNVHVKLAGSALADEETGQVTVSFQNLPQTPFSDFNLHFFGSERGLLATPEQCGTYCVSSTFTPWDSAALRTDLDPVLHLEERPGRQRLPADRRGRSSPPSRQASPTRPPPSTRPSRWSSTATTANRR